MCVGNQTTPFKALFNTTYTATLTGHNNTRGARLSFNLKGLKFENYWNKFNLKVTNRCSCVVVIGIKP